MPDDLLINFSEVVINFFSSALLKWFEKVEKRDLPWKASKNPYFIWLSEIILQQTRVEQGKPYYTKFVTTYPTINDLANAPEDEVLKLWQGLGYYSRARNLHFTAQYIRDNYAGQFPETYTTIRALKGVGDYTAAAIASFAFDLSYAVVDGNVYRVLARYLGLDTPIDSTQGKKQFQVLAQYLLDKKRPSDYNQAIMDLGATVCKPKRPNCKQCPLKKHCTALTKQSIHKLPVKAKKLKKKTRYFYYLVWENTEGTTIIHKRSGKGIWQGLYDFPLIESEVLYDKDDLSLLIDSTTWKQWWEQKPAILEIQHSSAPSRQQLSHQTIIASFIKVTGPFPTFFQKNSDYLVVNTKKLNTFAVPKIIADYLTATQLDLFGQ